MLTIRPAELDDAAADPGARHGWQAGYRGLVPERYCDAMDRRPGRAQRWRDTARRPRASARTLVAVADGTVVGFVSSGRTG